MAQPTDLPRWSTDVGTTTEPTEDKKDEGFVAGEKPAAQTHNWLFNTIYLWCDYLKNLASENLTWTGTHTFSNNTGPSVKQLGIDVWSGDRAEGPGVVNMGNTILCRGHGTVSGGTVTVLSDFGCTIAADGGGNYIEVTFDTNYTSFGTSYDVHIYANAPHALSSGVFKSYRCIASNKAANGFRLYFLSDELTLSGPTLSTSVSPSLSALPSVSFSFLVFNKLASFSITV